MPSSEAMARPGGNRPNSPGLPPSPMGMMPQDGGPRSGSPQRGDGPRMMHDREHPPMGYHPGGYGGPSYHPHYPPPPPPQGHYNYPGSYPPYGYPGPPPPPHMSHYPGYAPPPYGYPGYGGGYPSQQPQSREKPPPEKVPSGRRKSPSRRDKISPRSEDRNSPKAVPEDDGELERLRATADVSPAKVMPMRTDFHFFVDDFHPQLRGAAEDQVRATMNKDGGDHKSDTTVDPFLLYSNLNCRLMKMWEDSSKKFREAYMTKEEDDRRRFMMDDEIACRHCATLTARARSPRLGAMKKGQNGTVKQEEDGEERLERESQDGDDDGEDDEDEEDEAESSQNDSELDEEEKANEETDNEDDDYLNGNGDTKKRTSPSAANGNHQQELQQLDSPPKKTRTSEKQEV